MRQEKPSERFAAVRLRVVGVIAGVAAVGVIATGGASGAPTTKKFFTATIAQVAQTQYTFTLTNHQTSTQTLGSANVTVPAGFANVSVVSVNPPAGKTWTAIPISGVIQLRSANKSALAPSESIAVTIAGTAGCAATPYVWSTQVKQSNDFSGVGNDFTPLTAGVDDRPSVSVIGPPSTFTFDPVASPQVVGASFSVTATAKDACSNVAIHYKGTASLSGLASTSDGTAPTYGTLSFADENGVAKNGVASTSVTAVQPQAAAALTASNGDASGPASNSFDVVTTHCKPSDKTCDATHSDGTKVTAPVPPAGGTTKLSLSGPGGTFACGGAEYSRIGSHVTVDPVYPEGETAPIQITIEWSLVTAGPGSRVVCMTKDNVTFEVPKCGRDPVPPCELTRSRTGDFLAATFLIAPNDPDFDFG